MQTVRTVILLLLPLLFSFTVHAPEPRDGKPWMNLEEAARLLKSEKRPVLIDLYTDWCGWCKVMDKKTYSNKNVVEYLQKKYYAVKLDAETRQTLQWEGRNYNFNTQYRTNEFAIYLTGGQLAYPTTVIIPPDGGSPQAIPGYLETREFEKLVKYFGEGYYKKSSYDDYRKTFRGSW